MIKTLKLMIFVVFSLSFFLLISHETSSDQADLCTGGPGVQIGNGCYPCSNDNDGVCPNDFISGTCAEGVDDDCSTAPPSTCSVNNPCSIGESGCSSDNECEGINVECSNEGICVCSLSEGDPAYCRPPAGRDSPFGCGICDAEQGDCDNDNECSSGLDCIQDVGDFYGFSDNTDVCINLGTCSQTCNDLDKRCGVWLNQCGEDLNCGICSAGEICNSRGRCEASSCTEVTFYRDADGDGYGNAAVTTQACDAPSGYVSNNQDCNDDPDAGGANANPGLDETGSMCNDGIDNDCDGEKDWDTAMYAPDLNNDLTRGPEKGDAGCAVGVTGREVLTSGPYNPNDVIEIACTATQTKLNSVLASVGGIDCNFDDGEGEWDGNVAIFKQCSVGSSTGSKIVRCSIDTEESYQTGNDQTVTINVVENCMDNDGDGYGQFNRATCTYSGVDCNDDSNAGGVEIHPGADEICDGIDNDCVGGADNGLIFVTYYQDLDRDGFGVGDPLNLCASPGADYALVDGDCNDDPDAGGNINPGIFESGGLCNDGIDNDCSQQGVYDCQESQCNGLEGTLSSGGVERYIDRDGDTYGFGDPVVYCGTPVEEDDWVIRAGDCNDNPSTGKFINPEAADICDGIDNDCNTNTVDGSGVLKENRPLNSNQEGVCVGSRQVCVDERWVDGYGNLPYYEATETSCDDGLNNDCDAEWDWDTLDRPLGSPNGNIPPHGDSSCSIGINNVQVIAPVRTDGRSGIFQNDIIQINCDTTQERINSVRAFIDYNDNGNYEDNEECNWNEDTDGWTGSTAIFRSCRAGMVTGEIGVKCMINEDRSYAINNKLEDTTTMTVQDTECSGFNQLTCVTNRLCDWCLRCDSDGKWNGLPENTCVSAGQCGADQYQCTTETLSQEIVNNYEVEVNPGGSGYNACGGDQCLYVTSFYPSASGEFEQRESCNWRRPSNRVRAIAYCESVSISSTTENICGVVTECDSGTECSGEERCIERNGQKIWQEREGSCNLDSCGCSLGSWTDQPCSVALENGCVTECSDAGYCLESESGLCNDDEDNDCDGNYDYDGGNSPEAGVYVKGDDECAVGVLDIWVSNNSPYEDEEVKVYCKMDVGRIRSVFAYIEDETSRRNCLWDEARDGWGEDVESGLADNVAVFHGCGNLLGGAGAKTITCSVYDRITNPWVCDSSSASCLNDRSFQTGIDKSIILDVKSSSCGSYDSSSCPTNIDPSTKNPPRCKVVDSCNPNNDYSLNSGCLPFEQEIVYECTLDQCGVQCCSQPDCGTQNCALIFPNTEGSCDNQCNNNQCGTCDLQCSCEENYFDIDGDSANGCEYACVVTNGGVEICDGLDNDCNGEIDDGLTAPDNDNMNGVCNGVQICTGVDGWVNNYPPEYEPGTELTCDDGLDNNCNNIQDCMEDSCRGDVGPNGIICCSSSTVTQDCGEDGAVVYTGCLNDNTQTGEVASFECSAARECNTITRDTENSCGTGCCFPGSTSECVAEGRGTSLMHVDDDGFYEICSAGDWKGANCEGTTCNDDGIYDYNLNCINNGECVQDLGECGQETCSGFVCQAELKSNPADICNAISDDKQYECANFFACNEDTNYECLFGGNANLCGNSGDELTCGDQIVSNSYDIGCSGIDPDNEANNFLCNVDICVSEIVTENPCCLCYSQCINAACNLDDRSPFSTSECEIAKNFQWTNNQCPFTGGT